MEINLETLVQLTTIVIFISACFKYIVINPLQTAIETLGKAITSLNNNLEKLQDQQHNLEIRVVALERDTKSAHHRINTIEEERK